MAYSRIVRLQNHAEVVLVRTKMALTGLLICRLPKSICVRLTESPAAAGALSGHFGRSVIRGRRLSNRFTGRQQASHHDQHTEYRIEWFEPIALG